jgi:hypothetical protein
VATARAVDAQQNTDHGNDLNRFYVENRVVDSDDFWVEIDGSGGGGGGTGGGVPIGGGSNRPPVISAVAVTLEGNTTGGYTGPIPGVTANDPDGDRVTLTNNAPAKLPLGVTSVNWVARDPAGAQAIASQSVTVVDTRAPSITCPADVKIASTTPPLGQPTASDIVDASVTITNNAPATFSSGTTVVTWRAVDDSGNAGTCTQRVMIPYTFTGFYVGNKYIGNTYTVTSTTQTSLTFSFRLADITGPAVTNPAVVTSAYWSDHGGAVQKATVTSKGVYELKTTWQTSWFINSVKTLTVQLNDGTSHAVRVYFPGI